MLSHLAKEEESHHSTYSVRCASKIPSAPAISSTAYFLRPSFAGFFVESASATSVGIAVVGASKNKKKKNDASFFSSLPERRTV